MDGLFFLAACVAIGIIQYWMYRNDRVGPKEPTSGLLAMERSDPSHKKAAPIRQRRNARQPAPIPRRQR